MGKFPKFPELKFPYSNPHGCPQVQSHRRPRPAEELKRNGPASTGRLLEHRKPLQRIIANVFLSVNFTEN